LFVALIGPFIVLVGLALLATKFLPDRSMESRDDALIVISPGLIWPAEQVNGDSS